MLIKALVALVPVSLLLVYSVAVLVSRNTVPAVLQLVGATCLVVVVLAHVAEALHLFPAMRWGEPDSVGHYIDLSSVVPVRPVRARDAARGRLQLLGALLPRGSFLVRESLGRLADRGGALGGLRTATRGLFFPLTEGTFSILSKCRSRASTCFDFRSQRAWKHRAEHAAFGSQRPRNHRQSGQDQRRG